jgi:uncharacterized membrane protein YfcA
MSGLLFAVSGRCCGIVVGSIWSFLPTLSQSHGQSSEILLGCMLALYGLYGLCVKKLPHLGKHERWLSPIIGYIGGAVTVATGVIIIPIVPYLQSLHLKRDELVQALGLTFTFLPFALLCFYTITRCQDNTGLSFIFRCVVGCAHWNVDR